MAGDGRGQLPGVEAPAGQRGPELGVRRSSPRGSERPVGAGGGERVWGSRPFSLDPRASGSGGAGWGRSPERAVAAAFARDRSCLYLAAQEWAGAVPEGAAQHSVRRSADRALPGTLPPAALSSSLRLRLPAGSRSPCPTPALDRGTGPIAAKGTVQSGNARASCSRTPRLRRGVPLGEAGMPGVVGQGC